VNWGTNHTFDEKFFNLLGFLRKNPENPPPHFFIQKFLITPLEKFLATPLAVGFIFSKYE